ncbi:putative cytochrome p450 protein [Naviculisporaceae sp. PSN 640]
MSPLHLTVAEFYWARALSAVFCFYLAHLFLYRVLYLSFIYPYYRSPLRHLPGPKDHHFFVGQSINQLKGILRGQSPNEPFVSWMRKWPQASLIRYLTIGNSEALLVTSLAAQKEILHEKCDSFQKPDWWVRLVVDIVGYGLVLAEGEEHKRQRRVLNGMFAISNLKELTPVFQTSARGLVDALDEAVQGKMNQAEVDIFPLISKATLDSVTVFALGVQPKSLGSSSTTSFEECYKEMLEPDLIGQIFVAINGYLPIRWLPVGPNQRYMHASKTIHRQLLATIKQRIQEVKNKRDERTLQPKEGRGFTDLLTYMVEKQYFAEKGHAWSEKDLLKQILTFYAAGHETTNEFLVWGTYALANFPHVATRLRKEVLELLHHSTSPTYAELEGLPYLNNFAREVLRMWPPATMIARQASEDVVVQGTAVPKGTPLLILPAVFHHNPTIWGQDCDEFDPDRWDRLTGDAATPSAFGTFSQGVRMCIGKVMTVLQFKVLMVEMVSRYDFQMAESGDLRFVNPSPVLRLNGGLKVKVQRAGVSN